MRKVPTVEMVELLDARQWDRLDVVLVPIMDIPFSWR